MSESITQHNGSVKYQNTIDEITPHQQAIDEYHCPHKETEIRYKIIANGTKQYKPQCLHCGKCPTNQAIAYNKIVDKENICEWDQELENGYTFLIIERTGEIRQAQQVKWLKRDTEWDRWYQDYLNSSEWYDKSQRVLKRDNYQCRACEKRQATQAHHLTYVRAGDEPLFDLVAVCKTCHDMLTALSKRGGSRE